MINKTAVLPALVFASGAALALAACESSGNYRVGWVGDTPPPGGSASSSSTGGDDGGSSSGGSGGGTASSSGGGSSSSSSGGTASSGGSGSSSSSGGTASSGGGSTGAQGLVGNVLVTAGNTVIGAAGKANGLVQGGVLPTAGVVTGKVTGVLAKTGQTLVRLGEGGTGGGLILDGAGGKVGALVGIDLGKGTVIAAPEGSKSLIGVNVLAQNPTTGTLATVGGGTGGKLLTVDVNGLGGATGGGLLGGVTNAPQPGNLAGTAKGAVKSTVGTVGGVVGGVTGGLLSPKTDK
ncbi:hypothetical protein M9978_03170 [Sphingomonas sp. MG17]|uniref:Collagen, middle region n=1 Tax=Sphingomonas tagetis TaxID=2949092 RepID=A0A9X2HP41_9SPHN|nr:hypothetical protein [Sphingomonas tagetis]MCP3729420.1 hypothetical protein [Sphingomonas tagetis]